MEDIEKEFDRWLKDRGEDLTMFDRVNMWAAFQAGAAFSALEAKGSRHRAQLLRECGEVLSVVLRLYAPEKTESEGEAEALARAEKMVQYLAVTYGGD